MQSQENFSQVFTQISTAFSSVGYKTQSLELLDANYMSQNEFIKKIQLLSQEIPFLDTILKYNNLFTLYPTPQLYLIVMDQYQIGDQTYEEIGVGANAKVFLNQFKEENFAVKTMKKINISMVEFYIQECINQYELIKVNKEIVLNFKGLVYINILNTQAFIYIPLELAEYSLFEYIQNNQITQEIYQYFYNLLIEMLILLHSNNYAHRDIKPQNILFIKEQGWKLADFGESIKYQQRYGLYKIQGTIAFLSSEISKQINKHKQIYQDLFKNDLYAVICTLVMIQNPQFKPKDLVNYMDNQNFDQHLQQLVQISNSDNPYEELQQFRVLGYKINLDIFKTNQQSFNSPMNWSIEESLLIQYKKQKSISQNMINIIDSQLSELQNNLKLNKLKRVLLYVTLLYPFQIHQLKNFNLKELNHQKFVKQNLFFLHNEIFKFIYLETFLDEYYQINNLLNESFKQQNLVFIIQLITDNIYIGNFQQAEQFLEVFGKIMFQKNFDSNLFVLYNLFHYKLQGKSPSLEEIHLQDNLKYFPIKQERLKEQKQFVLEYYLIQDKFLNSDTVNIIELFWPFICDSVIDSQTLNIVFRHIIQHLGFNEVSIVEDQFKIANFFQQQLIKAGYLQYKRFINRIIFGIIKLFFKYDLFEGLLELLHYFLYFMKFIDRLMYLNIISVIQNLVFKLNIPIYQIKVNLDQKINQIITKFNPIRQLNIFIFENLTKIQFNMIQDLLKTEQYHTSLDNYQLLQNVLNQFTVNKSLIIYKHKQLFSTIQSFVQFLDVIESQNQKYLSLLVLLVCKCLYGESSDSYEINREITKFQNDPILLKYFINCRQYNRINHLFNQKKTKNDLKPFYQKLLVILVDQLLTNQNNFNKNHSNHILLDKEKLCRFALNKKFRQLFDFKQHMFALNFSKLVQKQIKVHNICLREQYLRVI